MGKKHKVKCIMKKKLSYIMFCLIVTVIIIAVLAKLNDDSIFFSENRDKINTNNIISYTIVGEGGSSSRYNVGDEQFETISNILTNAEVTVDKDEVYLIDEENSEHIVVRGRCRKTVFIIYKEEKYDDNVKIILKDFCKNRSTTYLLDNHKYLITTISIDDYNKIFNS